MPLILILNIRFRKASKLCAKTEQLSSLRKYIAKNLHESIANIRSHRLSTIMRADRILVVMNGEIIEEGTHDELIHAKGKYLGLWSKQVYIKPADGHARSQSPKKRDAEIINDLTPTRQKAELAKVIQTTAQEEPASDQESTKQSAKEPSKELAKQLTKLPVKEPANEPANLDANASGKGKSAASSGHKREVRDDSH